MEHKVVPPNKWDKSKWRVLPVLTYDQDRCAQQSTGMQVGVDLLMMRKVKGVQQGDSGPGNSDGEKSLKSGRVEAR